MKHLQGRSIFCRSFFTIPLLCMAEERSVWRMHMTLGTPATKHLNTYRKAKLTSVSKGQLDLLIMLLETQNVMQHKCLAHSPVLRQIGRIQKARCWRPAAPHVRWVQAVALPLQSRNFLRKVESLMGFLKYNSWTLHFFWHICDNH